MAGSAMLQFSKNTTETLKDMGFTTRGDISPEAALTVNSYDMRKMFGKGDKVSVWHSDLKKTLSDTNIVSTERGVVVDVTRKLVTVRYEKAGWTECFSILDYLGKRICLVSGKERRMK